MEKDLTTGSVGKAVVRFSLPFLLSYFLQTLYGMADLFIIGHYNGVESTAAVSIGILFLVPSSMLSTVSALASQNLGAGEHGRARQTLRYAILIAVGWGILAAVVMQLAAEPFVSLFVDGAQPGSTEVVRLGGQYMRSYVWDCLFAGITFSFSGYFCACGLSMIPFLHNCVSIVCVRIPLCWLLSRRSPTTCFPWGWLPQRGRCCPSLSARVFTFGC